MHLYLRHGAEITFYLNPYYAFIKQGVSNCKSDVTQLRKNRRQVRRACQGFGFIYPMNEDFLDEPSMLLSEP